MASQRNLINAVLMFLGVAVVIARGSPVLKGGSLTAEDVPRTLQESPEESLNRFLNDPVYRAGYERAVYDLYTGRFHELFETPSAMENAYPVPSKKAIDLGLGRFNAGSRAANSLMALDSARFAGGMSSSSVQEDEEDKKEGSAGASTARITARVISASTECFTEMEVFQ